MVQASAIFDSHDEAQRAVSELRSAGVSDSELSAIAHHGGTTTTTAGDGEITDEHHRNVLRGILGGGALGAGLGIAALAIPGVGPLAAAGAIAASAVPEAAAIGAGIGALGGTLSEVLSKHGVSDEDADYYGSRLKSGGVVVTVSESTVDAERAREILYRNGGHSSTNARAAALWNWFELGPSRPDDGWKASRSGSRFLPSGASRPDHPSSWRRSLAARGRRPALAARTRSSWQS